MTNNTKTSLGPLLIIFALLIVFAYLVMSNKMFSSPTIQSITPLAGSDIIRMGTLAIDSENVEYSKGVTGYYAYPAESGKYPGVILIHEWWGLTSNIKDMARNLASHGYRVLAVDLYSGKIAENMKEAQSAVSNVIESKSMSNIGEAKKFLLEKDSSKVAVLGWCFGGGQALRYSMSSGGGLSATVIYYGTLSTDSARLSRLKWPVLGIFGDKDTSIPVESVNAFQMVLNKNKTPNEIYIYPGVGHAFANPTGSNYAPKETKDAWEKTLNFLDKYLH